MAISYSKADVSGVSVKTYTVEKGDTLSEIAKENNIDYKELAEYNHISNPSNINVGQEIKIPTETLDLEVELDQEELDKKILNKKERDFIESNEDLVEKSFVTVDTIPEIESSIETVNLNELSDVILAEEEIGDESKSAKIEEVLLETEPETENFIIDIEPITEKITETEKIIVETEPIKENKIELFENDTINDIYNFFLQKGLEGIQIAAILGNLQYETASSFDPACNWERLKSSDPDYYDNEYYDQKGNLIYTEQDLASLSFDEAREKIKGLVPKFGGIGFLQWTGGKFDGTKWVPAANGASRKAEYLNWCNQNNIQWDALETQLEYLWAEYSGWSLKENFEDMTDIRQAATYFCDYYECPGDSSSGTRSDYAESYYSTIIQGM